MLPTLNRSLRWVADSAKCRPLRWIAGAVFFLFSAIGFVCLREATSSTRATPGRIKGSKCEWKSRHAAQKASLIAAAPQLLFVGDSITKGWTDPKNGLSVWNLHAEAWDAFNFGLPGDRTENLLWRLQDLPIEKIEPRTVVVLIGTNNFRQDVGIPDRPEEAVRGIAAVIQALRIRMPKAQLVLMAIFPADASQSFRRERIAEANRQLASFAAEREISFLNIGSQFLEPDDRLDFALIQREDSLHLTERGYERWARAIQPTLNEFLNPPARGASD